MKKKTQHVRSGTKKPQVLIVLVVALVALLSVPDAAAQLNQDDITRQEVLADINYDLEHPRVYHTPEEVQQARWNAEHTAWGRAIKRRIIEQAREVPSSFDQAFAAMSEEAIRALAPIPAPNGTTYFGDDSGGEIKKGTRCPIDRTLLHMMDLDTPGKVRCEEGHVFPGRTYDGVHITDNGDGWGADEIPDSWAIADIDGMEGTTFWFVATYNGRISGHMSDALVPLAYAYTLTGDTTYARKAAALLDVLATAMPTSYGPIVDWQAPWTENGIDGRLHQPYYQVGRILRDYNRATDLIWPSGVLDAPSPTQPGLSIKENVARNLIVEAADFAWRDMHGGTDDHPHANYASTFHNGTTDYNEGMLGAASLLGLDVGYARWALDGPVSVKSFLANAVFRDGLYYETAAPYYGPESFQGMGELAYHVRNEAYPEGLNLYDNLRYVNLNVRGPARFTVAGRQPHYGGGGPADYAVHPDPVRGDFGLVLRYYARASDPVKRADYAQRLAEIAGGDPNERLAEYRWALFNIDEKITGFDLSKNDSTPRASELLPGKGFVMYRPETGLDRGAMLRYGPPVIKSHKDGLGLHIYGGGRELSYDPGRFPKNHVTKSWNKQTVAHNTVVANAWSQAPPTDDGGSLGYFADRPGGYTVASVENAGAYAHEDVDMYQRTTAFVDASDEQSYLVDIFRVAGADTADYSFHGQGTDFSTSLDLSAPSEGSVASPDYCWGDKILKSGLIAPLQEREEGLNAPPGNGYGMLCAPQRASGDATWQATWSVDSSRGPAAKLRLTMLPDPSREVIVANAPEPMVWNLDLDPKQHELKYILARNTTPQAQYVSVIEPVADSFPVERVTPLNVTDGSSNDDESFEPVAFQAEHADGQTIDYFLSASSGQSFTAGEGDMRLTTDAAFAMVRVRNGAIQAARFEEGTKLRAELNGQPLAITAPTHQYEGRIRAVNAETPSLLVEGTVPTGDQLSGQHVIIEAPAYSHNAPYVIDRVEREGNAYRIYLKEASMTLARGNIEQVENGALRVADLPLSGTRNVYVPGNEANEYYDGRQLVNTESGATTTIRGVGSSNQRMRVAETSDFKVGDSFKVMDVQAGDRFRIPVSVEVRPNGESYVADAPEEVEVDVPGNK